jgi:HPt (histidine-containing phosphotransfer) domain-containing protein
VAGCFLPGTLIARKAGTMCRTNTRSVSPTENDSILVSTEGGSNASVFHDADFEGKAPNHEKHAKPVQCTTFSGSRLTTAAVSAEGIGVCEASTLEELVAEGENLFADLVKMFREETPRRLGELTSAFSTGDCAVIARVAHTLKGAAGIFGAKRMHALAERMELLARAQRTGEAALLFNDLCLECERVQQYLLLKMQIQT